MQTCIISIDTEGIIKTVDKYCCELFGYELDELRDKNVSIIIPTPYKEQHNTYLQAYLQSGVPKMIGKSRLIEAQHKDGTIFPIRLSVSKFGEGKSAVFVGIIDKIEESAAVATIGTNGTVVSCNQNLEEVFGYKPSEIIGKNVNILMPSSIGEKHDGYLQNYSSGKGSGNIIGHVRNVAAKHKDGTIFPISLEVEKMQVGEFQLFRGRMEKVGATESFFTMDENGTIISCNTNFVKALCGYSNGNLVGQNISILIADESFQIPSKQIESIEVLPEQDKVIQTPPEKDETVQGPAKKLKLESSEENKQPSWTPGIHKRILKHKDESLFPVTLEIIPFQDEGSGKWLYSARIKRTEETKQEDSDLVSKMIGPYNIIKVLGAGSYGKVKLGCHKETKENVAIKILDKTNISPKELERFEREIQILKQLSHPHIARLIDVMTTKTKIYIVMDYVEKTLYSYIKEKGALSEEESRTLFWQILAAIRFCHGLNIIHRDIKQQNILLDNNNHIKLIDFGMSNFMEDGKLRSTFCGTPAYAAPEMILGVKYLGPGVDIWSLGVVLYSTLTGTFPFENVEDVIKGNFKDPKNVSLECCDFLRRILRVEPSERMTIQDMSKHPWLIHNSIGSSGNKETKEVACTVVSTVHKSTD